MATFPSGTQPPRKLASWDKDFEKLTQRGEAGKWVDALQNIFACELLMASESAAEI